MQIILKKFRKKIKNPKSLFRSLGHRGFFYWMDDKSYLEKVFRIEFGRGMDLKNPQTFNEKLQWLKLYDRKPEYTMMVDKIEVRKYIAETIGEEYLIPCLGTWNRAEDINFDDLPDQFVLKCNHNSGLGMCICKDKASLNIKKTRTDLNKGLRQNYFYAGREWPYKNVKPRIIAEKYMVDESGTELKDYKFMCFNGKVKCSFVCNDRTATDGLKVTFFDLSWNVMPFERHYPKSTKIIKKPKNYSKMIELAEDLAKNIPFVRVDFYEVNQQIYFGELTFFPGSGFEEFTPEDWDYKLGSWLKLPEGKIK